MSYKSYLGIISKQMYAQFTDTDIIQGKTNVIYVILGVLRNPMM